MKMDENGMTRCAEDVLRVFDPKDVWFTSDTHFFHKNIIRFCNRFKGSKSNAGCIQAIRNAMDEKKKVVLKNYASDNSGEVRDRVAEPFAFTNNHIDIWAFDTEKKENRIFKIPRIEWVDILSEDWEYESEHHRKNIDDFRMSYDGVGVPVKLELSLRAKNILVEEFPLAEARVWKEGDKWFYEGHAGHMEGVGRFCIGLAGDVKVVDSPELVKYINDYVKHYLV